MNHIRGSLAWKLAIPVLILFVVTVVSLAVYVPMQMRASVVDNAVVSSQQTVERLKALRKYYASNVISEVLASPGITAGIDHVGKNGMVPLPATMVHDLSGVAKSDGTSFSLYSALPFPNRSLRTLDDFEIVAWDRLVASPNESFVREEVIDGVTTLRVAVADKMVNETCVNCHNSHPKTPKTNWKLGDVRGVLEVRSSIDDQLAMGQRMSWTIVGALSFAMVAMLATLFALYRSLIGQRLEKLKLAMENCKLSEPLDESGVDEIAQVSKSFNAFTRSISSSVAEMHSASVNLDEVSCLLSEASNESSVRIDQQHDKTVTIASSISQMSAQIDAVVERTVEAKNATRQAEQDTDQGKSIVNDSMVAINDLAREVESASSTISELETDAENIGSVLDVIRGIAEQTNLLALNAAIEAARAGEQGRGFAVVADEVRTLATRTQQSTDEIQRMIENLQGGARKAVEVMNKSCGQAEAGVGQVRKATEALDAISRVISTISQLNADIADSAVQQKSSSGDVVEDVGQISGLSQNARESAARTESGVAQLRRISAGLNSSASHFKS